MIKKIFYVLLAAFLIIQFIRPAKNIAAGAQPNYIGNAYATSDSVKSILSKACNDCHSNNTKYPWYALIQPTTWWLNNHITDGRKQLNFDEFVGKKIRFQYKKMEEVIDEVKEKKMPLDSYTWIHKEAILTDEEKKILFDWANSIREQLRATNPIDSLVRKKP